MGDPKNITISSVTKDIPKLEAFSDQEIELVYKDIQPYQSFKKEYDITELLQFKDSPTVMAMGGILNEVIEKITEKDISEMTEDDLDVISLTLTENIFSWQDSWKSILRTALIIKIVDNIDYVGGRVTARLLRSNFQESHTDPLMYIWLSSLRNRAKELE